MNLERIQINLREMLALLLQMSPNQQLSSMLLVLGFLLILNLISSALYEATRAWFWVSPLLIVALIGIAFGWLWLRPRQSLPHPTTGEKPDAYPGLILFLSLFQARADQQKSTSAIGDWRRSELQAALAQPVIDWPTVLARFEHSNMQPALSAIRHHAQAGLLKHIWLISTQDEIPLAGKKGQEGSCHLAPLFAKILTHPQGFAYNMTIHHADPLLQIPADDVGAAYAAVEYVFGTAAPQAGLAPYQVIADITGGRATMSGGMVLACAPCDWAMQYTTTARDPAQRGPGDTPVPLRIRVDARQILQRALQSVGEKLDLST
ncbi:hypothetical protein BH10CHL1_BH10CHL1_50230 [soil metagenome]